MIDHTCLHTIPQVPKEATKPADEEKSKRRKRSKRQAATVGDSSESYSDNETKDKERIFHGTVRRRPRSARIAASGASFPRHRPPPSTREQPVVINSDDEVDATGGAGNACSGPSNEVTSGERRVYPEMIHRYSAFGLHAGDKYFERALARAAV